MKCIDAIALFILSLTPLLFQDWTIQAIDNRATMSFPGKPVAVAGHANTYKSDIPAQHLIFGASVADSTTHGMDSATLITTMTDSSSLAAYAQGLSQSNPGSSILSKTSLQVKGHFAIDVSIKSGEILASKGYDRMYIRAIIAGSKIYSCFMYYPSTEPHTEIRNKFFDSFVLKY